MAHFAIAFNGNDPDPAHTGDIKSWFFYYKWRLDEDDEVFVPVETDACETATAGDTLWFLMDGELVGKATLLRVQYDPFNGRKELWFRTKDCIPSNKSPVVGQGMHTGMLEERYIEPFEALLK
jgi:hypothetical protein